MYWGVECCFFFQAEDGIRDAQESRGLGDVYKRQTLRLGLMLAEMLRGPAGLLDSQEGAASMAGAS